MPVVVSQIRVYIYETAYLASETRTVLPVEVLSIQPFRTRLTSAAWRLVPVLLKIRLRWVRTVS